MKTWNWINFFLWFFNGYSMIYDILVASEIPWNRIWHLSFQKPNQSYQHFNWNSYQPWSNTPYKKQMAGIQLFLSWRCFSHTKGFLSCFIWDLKVDNDPKGGFVSFKFTPSNDRVLCLCPFSVKQQGTAGQGAFLWRTTKLYGK